MRGPKPKSRARALAEGDTRQRGAKKYQKRLAAIPVAEAGLPVCPERLKGDAREAYEFWCDQLEKMSLAEMPDGKTLERAAVQWATANKADAKIAADGEVIDTPIVSKKGEIVGYKQVISPWVKIREKADTIFRQFASEFGLSPVSRTRLTIEKKGDPAQKLKDAMNAPRTSRAAESVQ